MAKGPILSFESYNFPGKFIRHANGLGEISVVMPSDSLAKNDASFELAPCLAISGGSTDYFSFKSFNYPNFYLRHQNGRLKLNEKPAADDNLYNEDASFKIVIGLADSHAVSFQSKNYPKSYIRHREGHLWVEPNDGSTLFKNDATFRILAPRILTTDFGGMDAGSPGNAPGPKDIPEAGKKTPFSKKGC